MKSMVGSSPLKVSTSKKLESPIKSGHGHGSKKVVKSPGVSP